MVAYGQDSLFTCRKLLKNKKKHILSTSVIIKAGEDVKKTESLKPTDGNINWSSLYVNEVMVVSEKKKERKAKIKIRKNNSK